MNATEYQKARRLLDRFNKWRGTRTSYHPSEVPKPLRAVTNELRSSVEVYEFVADPPARYFLYVNMEKRIATTWTGEQLGTLAIGREWQDNFGGTRVSIDVLAVNGEHYHGTYFKSAGDYARITRTKRN